MYHFSKGNTNTCWNIISINTTNIFKGVYINRVCNTPIDGKSYDQAFSDNYKEFVDLTSSFGGCNLHNQASNCKSKSFEGKEWFLISKSLGRNRINALQAILFACQKVTDKNW